MSGDSSMSDFDIELSYPKVSVIMNCLNGEKYLKEAIDSVYAQTFKDWEIIFWDNGSTDRSGDIAKSYDNKLRYFRADKTVSLGQARNYAIEKASGEYIAILDCDDIWLPRKLENQLPFFHNPRVALVFSDVVQFNNRGYAMPKYGNRLPPQGMVFKTLLFNNFVCMSTVMIRSDVIKKHNNWFDTTFTAIEDTDLFIRIARDWEFAYTPCVLCRYRMHENSMSHSVPLLFRKEEKLMMEKFSKLFPEFKELYEHRIKEQIRRDQAVVEWKQGNNSEARKLLSPIIFRRMKYLCTYLAMFLPYTIVHRFRLLFSKRAISNY